MDQLRTDAEAWWSSATRAEEPGPHVTKRGGPSAPERFDWHSVLARRSPPRGRVRQEEEAVIRPEAAIHKRREREGERHRLGAARLEDLLDHSLTLETLLYSVKKYLLHSTENLSHALCIVSKRAG